MRRFLQVMSLEPTSFPVEELLFFRCCLILSYIIFEQHVVINGVAVKTPQFLTSRCIAGQLEHSGFNLAVGVICRCGLCMCAGSFNNFHARGLKEISRDFQTGCLPDYHVAISPYAASSDMLSISY